jgi:hypothetical protein
MGFPSFKALAARAKDEDATTEHAAAATPVFKKPLLEIAALIFPPY